MAGRVKGQRSRGRRQGNVFALRLEPAKREQLEAQCAADSGPKKLGPWLVWRASLGLGTTFPGSVLPELAPISGSTSAAAGVGTTGARGARAGTTSPAGYYPAAARSVLEDLAKLGSEPPISERLILDLCAGSGAWSEPYRAAGYPVVRVTLPGNDVRTYCPPDVKVWGVLAAPPCTEFSLAKNGHERDFLEGLSTVNACMRLILTARPRWWALENPVGLLGRWLGRPRFVFQPCDFGDPWTKRTALWGDFDQPVAGPHVQAIDGGGPLCAVCHPDDPRVCDSAEHRAVTPAGFARAFFEANP
jgi:hypothetical protein